MAQSNHQASRGERLLIPRASASHIARRAPLSCAGIALVFALGGCATAALALAPTVALAEETSALGSAPTTDAVPDELQQRVEETAAAYSEAVSAREALDQELADTQAHLDELNAQLPELRDRAADAMRTAYKYQQNGAGLVDLLLSSDDFSDFITTVQYLSAVQEHGVNQIAELTQTLADIEATQAELAQQQADALAQEHAAQEAYEQAQAAREEAKRRAEEEAARQAAAQQAALQAAAEQAAIDAQASRAAASKAGASGEAPSENAGASAEEPSAPAEDVVSPDTPADTGGSTGGDAGWTDERSAYIAEWGARIDAYLAGSPMAGHGSTFAAAAWDYGVDPRWSPAIALVESSLGAYCFLPYNAWGWGSSSWGSWDEAIYAHVAGLARGYGYTLTYDAAQRYCPPNADYWYAAVLGQMESI